MGRENRKDSNRPQRMGGGPGLSQASAYSLWSGFHGFVVPTVLTFKGTWEPKMTSEGMRAKCPCGMRGRRDEAGIMFQEQISVYC